MPVISMKQLLEAGVHFGHPTRKWNPKMRRYIYAARNDIYIINLEKTVDLADEAYAFVKKTAESGRPVLFVGTKKQAQEVIMAEAQRCGMFFVNSRWLGGTLTNFSTIRSRVDRLNKINQMEKMNEFNVLPKKEVLKLTAERDKLETTLGGIKDMRVLPCLLFVVDPKKEHLAVKEARSLKIPIVGIVDTNCDPDEVDYVIPGNDDAIRSIKLISAAMADAVIEAREGEEGLAARRSVIADGEKSADGGIPVDDSVTMEEAVKIGLGDLTAGVKAEKFDKSDVKAYKTDKPYAKGGADKDGKVEAKEKGETVETAEFAETAETAGTSATAETVGEPIDEKTTDAAGGEGGGDAPDNG